MSESIAIREPTLLDAKPIHAFGLSKEIRHMYGVEPGPLPEFSLEHAKKQIEYLIDHPCAWIIEKNQLPVGHVRLDSINEADRRARLAIGLYSEEHLSKGIGRKAIKQVLKHAFEKLTLHRIDLRVLEYNRRAIKCYLACGFTKEGVERDSAFINGKWENDVIMSILSYEFD